MNNKILGNKGEKYIQSYLHSQNYEILTTNFYCKFGEIDIIAIDYSSDKAELVFIEVKTRKSIAFGIPNESITKSKMQKILRTALHFLNSSTQNLPFSWRIDVIGLQLNSSNTIKQIDHIKNIFNGA
jgi:putative endonuclease